MTVSITFDVEPDLHTQGYLGITQGIPAILGVLDKHDVKGTFFTTADCIEKHPKIFQKLKKEGHEIALHGYRHSRFDDLSPQEKDESIKKSIEVFKKNLKSHPKGFRAPQHSIDEATLKILEKYDIKYDSSKTPLNAMQFLFFPKRLKRNVSGFFSNPRMHKMGKVTAIPPTSLFVPFVSLALRVFPRSLQKIYFSALNAMFDNLVFYAHSWDFIPLPGSRIDRRFPYTRVIKNLDFLIATLKQKHKFVKAEELI